MKFLFLLFALLIPFVGYALTEQEEFDYAETVFDPYYAGPLLAPGASIPKPGHFAIQPFLFLTDTYGAYDNRGRAQSIPSIHTVNANALAFAGITEWVGLQAAAGYIRNHQSGNTGSGWTDPSVTLLLPVVKESVRKPAVMLAIREAFPVGRYQHLNPEKGGVDAIGSGAYLTSIWLNFAKMITPFPRHPMRFRLSNQYTLPSRVSVREFNSYGGGFGTRARVHLPHTFRADFGSEFSFTQNWVAALDIVYIYAGKVTFTGFPGIRDGECAPFGGPHFEQLSLAPAIQYNVNSAFGFIAGPWFTVWGRNSGQFISAVFSFYVRW